MQRVIQRTATARKQAFRRAVKEKEREELMDRIGIKRSRKEFGASLSGAFQAQRKSRLEDWEKGPLAPMRDSGLERTTYGGLSGNVLHPPRLPKHEQREYVLFAEGDQVCLMRGWNQGKIGTITQVNRDSETVLIKDVNMADVIIPEWAKDRMGQNIDTQPQSFPVPFDDIRHVIRLEDAETGKLETVLVKHAYAAGPYHERPYYSKIPNHTRYVTGLDIEIPWPLEEEPVITDGDMDTPRMEVEASTFVASLGEPPMPSTVIDELRNKYSKFRTRHDPEYLKAKMTEDYEKEYRETASLFTPGTDARNLRAVQAREKREKLMDADGNLQMTIATKNMLRKHLERQHGVDKELVTANIAGRRKAKRHIKLAKRVVKAAKIKMRAQLAEDKERAAKVKAKAAKAEAKAKAKAEVKAKETA